MGCYKNQNIPLAASLIAISNYNISNCTQHMEKKHGNDSIGEHFRYDTSHTSSASLASKSTLFIKTGKETSNMLVTKTIMPELIIERGNNLLLQFMHSSNMTARHLNSPFIS